jgi:hypothetical protein
MTAKTAQNNDIETSILASLFNAMGQVLLNYYVMKQAKV